MLNPGRRSLWWVWGMYRLWLSSVVVVCCHPLALSLLFVVRWCCPLALSLALGIIRWHCTLSVGPGVVRWHCHWHWASSIGVAHCPLVLVLSVGAGVVRWHWRCLLASSLALSVRVVVVCWLVNGCEHMWALVMVVGASGMGVVRCCLTSMVVLVGVRCVAHGCRGCSCG